MGMTIDKTIDIMERYEMYGFNAQKDGRNKAIEIMRKYQQIEEIVKEWSCGFGDGRYMYMVGKVVEDGKID